MFAFMHGIIQTKPESGDYEDRLHASLLMAKAIQAQCDLFLQTVPLAATIDLHSPRSGIRALCAYTGLQSNEEDFVTAMKVVHNATTPI